MRRRALIVILFVSFLLVSEAVAANDEIEVVIGFQTAADAWKLNRKSWSTIAGIWAYTPILEAEARDPVFGPWVEFTRGWFFARAGYLTGSTSLDELGKTDLSYFGGDVGASLARGHITVFLGIRHLSLEFEKNEYDVEDQAMTDVALGLFLRTDPERQGFFFDLGGAFGLLGIADAIGDFETDANAPPRADMLMEAEMMLGYRPPDWPLAFRVGYHVLGWQDAIGECARSREGPCEGVTGSNHGLVVEVQYVIGS
jgi:hypothetical protein